MITIDYEQLIITAPQDARLQDIYDECKGLAYNSHRWMWNFTQEIQDDWTVKHMACLQAGWILKRV